MDGFVQTLLDLLREKAGDTFDVEFKEVIKINDVKLRAINLRRPGKNICRNFYVEDYFQQFQKGGSIDMIADNIFTLAKDYDFMADAVSSFDFYDFDVLKDHIIVKLMNYERNRAYLLDKVYLKYLDFAVCFYVYLGVTEDRYIATTTLPDSVFETWNISRTDLLEIAMKNMEYWLPGDIFPIQEAVTQIYEDPEVLAQAEPIRQPEAGREAIEMYILSNVTHTYGAATILYKDILKDFADEKGVKQVYILPSSLHEVLLVPGYEQMELPTLTKLVTEVNVSSIAPGIFLSDHAYVYERESDMIL